MGKQANTKEKTKGRTGRPSGKKEIRRHPRNRNVHSHWKFKNSHINHKFEKKQKKLLSTAPKNQIQKQEDEIAIIETENDLFDANGNVDPQNTDVALLEWDNENEGTETIPSNMNEIFNKMDAVNEKKLEPKVIEAYKMVGEVLRSYTSGKLPKAFNILPATENWEDLINITEPFNWTPQAMYEATILFSSGFNPALAEIFYEKYLLPAIRNDIKKNKKLNIHYYNCLKKSLFKPAAFFKGIILPLSKSLSSKEAAIIGSILRKCSIPMVHAAAAIMKLIQYCKQGRNGISVGAVYFIRLLLLKRYSVPQQVKEALVNFFCEYQNYKGKIPVMWYQLLLIFVQQYKLGLTDKEKERLKELNQKVEHQLISPEISKELNYKKGKEPTHHNSTMEIE